MNDPHVVALNYVVRHNDSIDYSKAVPLRRDEPGFRLTVENKKARFEFKEHHASEEQAKDALEKYIRVWQFDAALKYGNPDAFRLVFEKAEIVDRNPTPGEVRLSGKLTVTAALGTARLTTEVRNYPSPPSDIILNPDAETMHQRYMGYRAKHEPLQSMAYFCLSMLEDPSPLQSSEERIIRAKRKAAAEKFDIDVSVLAEIGHLSTTRGGADARKREGTARPLIPEERHFLDRAVKAIIRRVAEREYTPRGKLPTISWSDLPPLGSEADHSPEEQK